MTVEDITNRLTQYYSWLSSRPLQESWPLLLAIAALVLILIVLVLRSRRKVLPSNAQLRDIIDIKLADRNKAGGQTEPAEKSRPGRLPERRGRKRRRINTTKGFKLAIRELNHRRRELIESRQAEPLVQQESAATATVNEQSQIEIEDEVTESRQTEELPEQKVAEIAAVIEQFQNEITETDRYEQPPKQQAAEFAAFNEQIQPEVAYSGPDEQPVQKVYEIVPDNEPFQIEVTGSRRDEEHPEQKVAETKDLNEQIPIEVTDGGRAEQNPIQKASEIAAVNEKFQYEKPEQDQPEKAPEESPEQDLTSKKQPQPLDIAEFSKAAISRRQRQRSGIFNDYSNLDED